MELSIRRKTLDPSPDILGVKIQDLHGASTSWGGPPFLVSQMWRCWSVCQTKIHPQLTRRISPHLPFVRCFAGMRKDAFQRPVETSQPFTTPTESTEITRPSFVCRLMNSIGTEASDVDSEPVVTVSTDGTLSCQSLIDPSDDDVISEEENVMDLMELVCPIKVPTR